MNIMLTFCFLFFLGSCIGWVIELLFRRFISTANKERKWINPGFLVGPYLPLYGFGLCTMYALAGLDRFVDKNDGLAGKIILFVVMALCMTGIEYIAGIIFIKGMKVKLWDYSEEWGNIQGIICPRFSIIWAGLGAVYYFLIHPYVVRAVNWLGENLWFSFIIGFFFGVFLIDTVYSCNILSKIRKFALESQIIVKYEKLKSLIRLSAEENKKKTKFFLSFSSDKPLAEHLKRYYETAKRVMGEGKRNFGKRKKGEIKSEERKKKKKKNE